MIVKTAAIALRIIPFSETSRVVIWLTREFGKLAALIKGDQRRLSLFIGQYDHFYTCELVLYMREHRGLNVVRECSPLKPRIALREQWRAMVGASYCCDFIARLSLWNAPHPGLFRRLDTMLDILAAQPPSPAGLFWFELKIMNLIGLTPQLRECIKCGRKIILDAPPAQTNCVFAYKRGGLLCGACAEPMGQDVMAPGVETLRLLRFWQHSRSWRAAQNQVCHERRLRTARELLGLFIRHHLEIEQVSRAIALDALWPGSPPRAG